MRKILGDGLKAPHENPAEEEYAELFVLGKSTKPNAPFANEVILEIAVGQDKFLVPLDNVFRLVDRGLQAANLKSGRS